MADKTLHITSPISEKVLRNLSKDLSPVIPKFSEKEPTLGVKQLCDVVEPILGTADLADLSHSHRAAACNVLCAIIEKCQALDLQCAHEAILDDLIWSRLFNIYLERSDSAKGKSVRQVLLVLTSVLLKNQTRRSLELQDKATTTFVDIICRRQDRLKVKPALQGLAHFLQKDVVSIAQLFEIYSKILECRTTFATESAQVQSLLTAFLPWIVHHDTSLSAGHLVKNFLAQIRRSANDEAPNHNGYIAPIWMQPVVESLHAWPDRIQEFKTHVFPHCFLPNFEEYLQFLSFLKFSSHVGLKRPLPYQLRIHDEQDNGLGDFEEFRILLASIETGKELGIVKDIDYGLCKSIEVHNNVLHLPDDIFGSWLSHIDSEVRLAGLFLCIYSTAVTRPITSGIFKSLKQNLVHLHTDTDANFRRELLSYTQKLFDRLRGSTSTLVKTKSKVASSNQGRLPFPRQCFQHVSLSRRGLVEEPLSEALRFIVWYIRFLEGELRSDASYQRRISALRTLTIVLKSGLDSRVPHGFLSKRAQGQLHWAHGLEVSNPSLIATLLDFVVDPFDDIREASILALHLCLESSPDHEKKLAVTGLLRFIARAEEAMLRTGRADQADGVARAYALHFSVSPTAQLENNNAYQGQVMPKSQIFRRLSLQLKETLGVARLNISEAVEGRPVHGIFAAIRYIVDKDHFYVDKDSLSDSIFKEWKEVHDEILASFELLWTCVENPLCADAPEGHVPEEMEEDTSLDTKEILSYSWRALKEASILLRVIASKASIGTHERALLHPVDFERLGRLSFMQLIELRHRGAFSTVAQTFATFCRRCVSENNDALRTLPRKWYEETISSIQAKANAITRRSGGIPALMAGIVAAEPQPEGELFPRVMRDLMTVASAEAKSVNIEESRLPQVHALNCIKEIFTTSRLSVASEAYIAEGLELAARTLNSRIWPIRNCSLMLFKALIERLLGSDEAQDWKELDRTRTSRFSYDNYPSLISIITNLLDPEGPLKKSLDAPNSNSPMDLHGAEGVFPALQILRQATPPEGRRQVILRYVQELLASPHWHLRDMAARTATSLCRPQELLSFGRALLASKGTTMNARHGTLLCAKYLLRKGMQATTQTDPSYLEDLMLDLNSQAKDWYTYLDCPITKAAFLDLISLCGMVVLKIPVRSATLDAWNSLTASISIGPEHTIGINKKANNALLQRSLAQVFFIDRALLRPQYLSSIISSRHQSIGDALVLLGREYPDTCSAALDILNDIVQVKYPQGPVMQLSLILIHVYRLIRDIPDPKVLSKAQAIFADGLSQEGMVESVFDLVREDDLLITLGKLETQCLEGAPSNMQSALRLLGFFLDWTYKKYPSNPQSLFGKIARYIKLLRMTIVDTNPFDDRFAAVQSISALDHIWTLPRSSNAEVSLALGLVFVLYDMLNDDDDEIRDATALATCKLLRMQQFRIIKPAAPIIMSHHLARFLVNRFSTSRDLCKEAIRRLIDPPPRNPIFAIPFADMLAEARAEDTALFSTEKQNLFKDDTLDANLWAHVLSRLPLATIPGYLRHGLRTWVIDALSVMIDTAKGSNGGALGWSSKTEVFTLGMRVICAAEVVLTWERQSGEGSKVRAKLIEFVSVGRQSEIHGLWLQKADALLEKSVVNVLSDISTMLVRMQKRL